MNVIDVMYCEGVVSDGVCGSVSSVFCECGWCWCDFGAVWFV